MHFFPESLFVIDRTGIHEDDEEEEEEEDEDGEPNAKKRFMRTESKRQLTDPAEGVCIDLEDIKVEKEDTKEEAKDADGKGT